MDEIANKIKFRKISLRDKELIKPYLKTYSSISCEFSFANLIVWSKAEQTEYCLYNGFLILRCRKDKEYGYYFPLTGDSRPNGDLIAETIADLKKYHLHSCDESGSVFKMVHLTADEKNLVELYFNGATSETNRDFSEYIYEADNFRTYSGRKLHGKKNHYNKFMSLYGDIYTYEKIDGSNIDDCIKMSEKWSDINKYYLTCSLLHELEFVNDFLNNMDALDLFGGLIKIDGEIKGFTIGETAFDGSDSVTVHVEKAMYEIDGIYAVLSSLFLRNNPQFKYVNREDDLGDEGLRASKLSYRPLYLLDKYTVII